MGKARAQHSQVRESGSTNRQTYSTLIARPSPRYDPAPFPVEWSRWSRSCPPSDPGICTCAGQTRRLAKIGRQKMGRGVFT